MDTREFRRLGHQLVDWVADYRDRVAGLPVMSPAEPGEVRGRMPASPPLTGAPLDGLIGDLERVVLPGITHWNHPRFFAYFPSNTSLASVLADLVIAGLGAQGMSWQTSPAATEIEEVMMDWLRQMVGLSTEWSGVVHDTASTATLCALLCARERASGHAQVRGGLQGGDPPLCVYASAQAHASVEKGALLAGFGRDHFRLIATDADHALRPDALAEAIDADLRAGRRPAAVVATIGTTATTAIDPLAAIARLAADHRLWLHVDAAMAGSAMILPERRWMWEGVEAADSLVLNPHKWLGVGFDYSAYFVRDPEHLVRVMSTNPSYLRTAHDHAVTNYRDWQIPLGRRFRALKFWFVVAEAGVEGLQARLRRDLAHARWLADQVDRTPGWERLAPVHLQTVCLRHRPAGLTDGPALDRHNLDLALRINHDGRAYLTPAKLDGAQMIRASFGAEATAHADAVALWRELQAAADRP